MTPSGPVERRPSMHVAVDAIVLIVKDILGVQFFDEDFRFAQSVPVGQGRGGSCPFAIVALQAKNLSTFLRGEGKKW